MTAVHDAILATLNGWSAFSRAAPRDQDGGVDALEDGKPRPGRVWNKIPEEIGTAIITLALEEPDLSPRELLRTSAIGPKAVVIRPALNVAEAR